MRAVLDTNILIDYLNGTESAREELNRYQAPLVSQVTWMEVLVGARDETEMVALRAFLARFERVAIDDAISERAVEIRRDTRIRLSDAIIWATANVREALLVTRNTRDFPAGDPGVRVPYRLDQAR